MSSMSEMKVFPVTKGRVFQRTDKVLQHTVRDIYGTIVDLTSWTDVAWRLWEKGAKDGTPLVEKTSGNGLAITDPGAGEIQVTLTKDDLDRDPGEYAYEVRRTDEGYDDVIVALSPFWLMASPSA